MILIYSSRITIQLFSFRSIHFTQSWIRSIRKWFYVAQRVENWGNTFSSKLWKNWNACKKMFSYDLNIRYLILKMEIFSLQQSLKTLCDFFSSTILLNLERYKMLGFSNFCRLILMFNYDTIDDDKEKIVEHCRESLRRKKLQSLKWSSHEKKFLIFLYAFEFWQFSRKT